MRAAGAALVLLGFLGLIFGGIPYNRKETVAEIGSIKMQATERKTFGLPPAVNGLAILIGTAMWFRGGRRPSG
jgi:hypothetical protein